MCSQIDTFQSSADFQSPFIFDETVDFAGTAGLEYSEVYPEGLLANSGALFSMSTFEKAPQGDVLDYHNTALHDPAYATYAPPHYNTHLLYPSGLPEENDQLHYMTSSEFSAANDPYEEHRPSYLDPRLRQVPEITEFTPDHGAHGDRVYVYVKTVHDLLAPPSLSISLIFATKRAVCLIEPLPSDHEALKRYVISAEVPSFISTGWHSFTVPLRMVMEAGNGGQGPQAVEVGAFTYRGQIPVSASQDLSRKRKVSSSSDEALQHPIKRAGGPQLLAQDAGDYAYSHNAATSPYSPFLPTPTGASLFQNRYQHNASPRSFGHHYSTSTASQASIKAPSPHTPSYSPSFATVNRVARSPRIPVTPATRPSAASSPGKATVPPLVRTSTLPGQILGTPKTSLPGSASTVPAFNAYAMYPHKAMLKLNGDLDKMAEDWSLEEWDAKRRLVHFTRSQNGSTILGDFKPVAPEDRQPSSICISCIWWAEKKECFVTSVDTIYLLEALVNVRFTVEEKNRIRRNLEGFRPLTVSKSKADSEDFFKIIMGFPNPKPRNIEKDVKVFPWKILSHALKKIISKYSASPSSTAGALHTPASYPSTGPSEASTEPQSSPHLGPMSAPVTASYNGGIPASSFSPRLGSIARMPTSTGPPSDLRLQVPAITGIAYSHPSTFSYQTQSVNTPQVQTSQPMTAPAGRSTSWDYAPFVNTSSAQTPMHSYNYDRTFPAVSSGLNYSAAASSYSASYPTTSG